MSGQVNPGVMQRMIGARAPKATDVPVTASRALRLAMTRAAERQVGLQLTVESVGEEAVSLDGLQAALRDDLLLLKLLNADGVQGVVALDRELIAAIIEVQTTGKVSSFVPEPRAVTRADLMFVQPVLDGLFAQLLETTQDTALKGWTEGIVQGDRFDDVRALGLALGHVTYRVMRLSLDLGVSERRGELLLALPSGEVAPIEKPLTRPQDDWAAQMRETIMASPAALTAELHRFRLPLGVANNLKVGQVLPLPGCTVSSVRLVAPDGMRVARAKLGQVAGHIAVRLETPAAPLMKSLEAKQAKPAMALTERAN